MAASPRHKYVICRPAMRAVAARVRQTHVCAIKFYYVAQAQRAHRAGKQVNSF